MISGVGGGYGNTVGRVGGGGGGQNQRGGGIGGGYSQQQYGGGFNQGFFNAAPLVTSVKKASEGVGPIYFYEKDQPFYEFTNFADYPLRIDGKGSDRPLLDFVLILHCFVNRLCNERALFPVAEAR